MSNKKSKFYSLSSSDSLGFPPEDLEFVKGINRIRNSDNVMNRLKDRLAQVRIKALRYS